MIDLQYIKNFYPASLTANPNLDKHLVKEFVELMAMDYLSTTDYIKKVAFIGGTNLRLIKGIDRFSEDLDFDCKDLSKDDFIEMTNLLIENFRINGLQAEARDKDSSRLSAYRRSVYFPHTALNEAICTAYAVNGPKSATQFFRP